ncbi:AzlD domain-containing protein [Bradyrhizobium sp. CCGUVB14]|uniref:AzlD domain-containing protein n=1 Tax=unclassified Bradyrhizobium TaxID=2631580 RepID=UPI0035C10CAE
MLDWRTLAAIGVLGLVSYVMRSGGFLAAGLMREDRTLVTFFRLAPGNLFVAFVAAACLEGGFPSILGCASAFGVMAVTQKEWAALAAGFATATLVAIFHSK